MPRSMALMRISVGAAEGCEAFSADTPPSQPSAAPTGSVFAALHQGAVNTGKVTVHSTICIVSYTASPDKFGPTLLCEG